MSRPEKNEIRSEGLVAGLRVEEEKHKKFVS